MDIQCVEQSKDVWRKKDGNQQNHQSVNVKVGVGVHDDRNEHCVEEGYRSDPVRAIYAKQLGLPEGVRIVRTFACKIQ